MNQEEIISAEQYAEKEAEEWCLIAEVDYRDIFGNKTAIGERIYQQLYNSYLFPIANVGGVNVTTVGTKLGK